MTLFPPGPPVMSAVDSRSADSGPGGDHDTSEVPNTRNPLLRRNMPLSLLHAVRVLPETIGECAYRDFSATLELTLNGGSVWQLPWSWFGPRDQAPTLERVEEVVASLLLERMKLISPL